jgi:hypothetical protein
LSTGLDYAIIGGKIAYRQGQLLSRHAELLRRPR